MALLTKITRRLQTLANLIENPKLFYLYQQGGRINTFCLLNQPWLHELNIATVLDIGANRGQFALTINTIFPKASIYSFEPILDCFEQLTASMKSIKNFKAFNIGLGESSGELKFERNAFAPSSSFLKMMDTHKTLFPFTCDSQTITVKVEKLDGIAEQLKIMEPLLVKVDVQGYEDRVLRGGEQTIKRAKLIIIETSFQKLYDEQPLFNDIYNQLLDWGFVYIGTLDQLHNPQNGQILQADSLFLKCSNN